MLATTLPTPPPTLSADEAQSVVLDLLKTNGGCRLPCWWGITPGETNSLEVATFFERLRSVDNFAFDVSDLRGGRIYLEIPREDLLVRLWMAYDINSHDNTVDQFTSIVIAITRRVDNGFEDVYGDALYSELVGKYMLTQMLSTYGKPSQILIFGNRRSKILSLLLVYSENGIFVNYSVHMERQDNKYLACPGKSPVGMTLWPPERMYSLENIFSILYGKVFGPKSVEQYLSLQVATSLTPDEFYNLFKDPRDQNCLETPVELWPEEP